MDNKNDNPVELSSPRTELTPEVHEYSLDHAQFLFQEAQRRIDNQRRQQTGEEPVRFDPRRS